MSLMAIKCNIVKFQEDSLILKPDRLYPVANTSGWSLAQFKMNNVLLMFSWNREGERWKKHSVHINYDFQLCKAERRGRRCFFFHMCSRFPGRRTMSHWLQAFFVWTSTRDPTPQRDAATVSPYLLFTVTASKAWAFKYQWMQTTWRVIRAVWKDQSALSEYSRSTSPAVGLLEKVQHS